MTYVIIYWIILFTYAIFLWRRNRSESSFLVNARNSGAASVAMSIVALVFGASSVFGLAGYSYTYGYNAIWWTFSGIIFLLLLRHFFVGNILNLKAYTISDTVSSVFGAHYKIITSSIILISWTMILAGQIIAGGTILDQILNNRVLSYGIFCMIFFSYTFITGQSGTIRTSWIQTFIMTAGLVLILAYTLSSDHSLSSIKLNTAFGFTDKFTPGLFISIFIPVGLSYLFGPDIYSRIFTAKDKKSATRGIAIACIIIAVLTMIISTIGIVGGSILGNVKSPDSIIAGLVSFQFSGIMKYILLVALVSIPLSGADAMLANMSMLLGKDIIQGIMQTGGKDHNRSAVFFVRGSMIIVLLAAFSAALNAKMIIPTLLIAYKIFSCAAVPLIMISMLSLKQNVKWNNHKINAIMGIYMTASALFIVLSEFNILGNPIQYLSLYLLLINSSILFILFLINFRNKTSER